MEKKANLYCTRHQYDLSGFGEHSVLKETGTLIRKHVSKLKTLLMAIFLLIAGVAYSQPPITSVCTGAQEKMVTEECEFTAHTFSAGQSEYWIEFTATGTEQELKTTYLNNDPAQSVLLGNITLYSGMCSSLVIDSVIINPEYDSTHLLKNLTVGTIYFLKIERDVNSECQGICNDQKGFELCLKQAPAVCLYWVSINGVTGVQTGGFCNINNSSGSVCHVNIKPCDFICFAVGCVDPYIGGNITYYITPASSQYNFWFDTTTEMQPICIIAELLTPATYSLGFFIDEPEGTTTEFLGDFTFTIEGLDAATDAVTSNTYCTYQDFINSLVVVNGTQGFTLNGENINYSDQNEMQLLFNSLGPGVYTICTEVVNECLESTFFCEDISIIICTPTFNTTVNCASVDIMNTSIFQGSYISWQWDFGDGTTFSGPNPGTHVYSSPGTYTITLTATDNTGQVHIIQQNVTAVFGVPMELNLPSNSCCTSPEISVNDDYYDYQWSIDPLVLWVDAGNTIYPNLDANTTYEICVTALDNVNNCPVTACQTIEPCCGFDKNLVPADPIAQDNHTTGGVYFTQVCEPEYVSNLIANFGWSSTMTNVTIVLRNDLIVDTDITFILCDIRVDEDKKMIVDPAVTLTLNRSEATNACDFMWEGIEVTDNSADLITLNGSLVTQAQNAVVSHAGGNIDLSNTTFLNNYRNVVINPYASVHPAQIELCAFTSTAFGMLAPFSTVQQPLSGVEINQVREVTIGQAGNTSSRNTFNSLTYGITSRESNLSIYNNDFTNITLPGPFLNNVFNNSNIAVWAIEGSTSAPTQFINVGDNSGNSQNTFSNCRKAIQAEGALNVNVIDNEFQNITITNILCRNTLGKVINILNNEISGRFGVGVLCMNFLKSSVLIKNNQIFENNGYNHTAPYLNTGIWLANVVPVPSLYQIENNTIYRCENGIIADGVPSVLIKNNSVIYQRNNTQIINTGRMHRGIWLKNSPEAEAGLNTVSRANPNPANNGTQTLTNFLHGITVELSEESYVHNNNLQQMGYGMRWIGSSINSTISCNIMERCYNGIFFDFAEVGHQGSSTNPSGNYWVNNQAVNAKMDGTLNTSSLPLTNWYAVLSGFTNPNPHLVPTASISILNATGNANCQIAPGGIFPGPMDGQRRNAMFGSIVRDEKQFVDFEDETREQNRRYVYRMLKENPSWINLGASDDTDYQNFFNTVAAENEGKIEEVNKLISDFDFLQATSVNSSVQSGLIAEENQKTVNEIYLATWANGIEIDSNQFFTLESIACQNPLEGGSSVYGARIMIGLDYECANGANRNLTIENENSEEIFKESNIALYPNPSGGLFTIVNDGNEIENGIIRILDVTGKQIAEFSLNSNGEAQFNLSGFSEGMYLYIIYSNDVIIHSDKLIISK